MEPPSESLPDDFLSSQFSCNYEADLKAEGPLHLSDCSSDLTEFTFETDHEALRSNPDYLALLRTLAVLQAQKIKAVKDLDRLVEGREEAMANPLRMVERLQRGESLFGNEGRPEMRQKLAEMPDIEWEKYRIMPASGGGGFKPTTRHKSNNGANSNLPDASDESAEAGCKIERTTRGQFMVRGRIFDEKKPKTFNQPWTAEEQRRLEELLVQYPSEDVEMERWKKIAKSLGNRTAVQVQSRTQKYFLKLAKAGLPIPGRMSKSKARYSIVAAASSAGRANNSLSRRYGGSLLSQKNSSFFPQLAPDVKMAEEEEEEEPEDEPAKAPPPPPSSILNGSYYLEEEDVSDEEGVPEPMRHTPAYLELIWLKRVRREKELEQRLGAPVVHLGFRCDGCSVEPIVGGRFQCSECKVPDTVDFCCECAGRQLEVGSHTKDHVLKPVRKKARLPSVDEDYAAPASDNYLDPNFCQLP